MEVEKNNVIPFLDVLVMKRTDGTLGHTVYRKETHTNQYLNVLPSSSTTKLTEDHGDEIEKESGFPIWKRKDVDPMDCSTSKQLQEEDLNNSNESSMQKGGRTYWATSRKCHLTICQRNTALLPQHFCKVYSSIKKRHYVTRTEGLNWPRRPGRVWNSVKKL